MHYFLLFALNIDCVGPRLYRITGGSTEDIQSKRSKTCSAHWGVRLNSALTRTCYSYCYISLFGEIILQAIGNAKLKSKAF